jgi:shikimate kinase
MPSRHPNILLIGLRGSGKTTLGRQLAEKLHRPFVDMDDQTAAMVGCETVAEAWEKVKESGFRQAETRVLKKLLAERGRVIALGGGSPTAPGARNVILRSQSEGFSTVIYLRASAHTLRERLKDTNLAERPSLTGTDSVSEIDLVLARRDGSYKSLADEVVKVDGLSEHAVLRELTSLLR